MRKLIVTAAALVVAGCSRSGNSNQESLTAAANQSTPEAAQVLNGAARNGMDRNDALNEAAAAQGSNSSAMSGPRLQARPNSRNNPNPRRPGLPPDKIATNSD
jgi:hypothetical protein